MRNLIFLFIISFIIPCNGKNGTITRIDIYYLPWEMTTQYDLNINDLKNFNNGKNSFYSISDTNQIKIFIKEFENLKKVGKIKTIDYRMLMEFYCNNKVIKTIGFTRKKAVYIEGTLYHSNYGIQKFLEENIPPAKNWHK
jgi:hypothetical protein